MYLIIWSMIVWWIIATRLHTHLRKHIGDTYLLIVLKLTHKTISHIKNYHSTDNLCVWDAESGPVLGALENTTSVFSTCRTRWLKGNGQVGLAPWTQTHWNLRGIECRRFWLRPREEWIDHLGDASGRRGQRAPREARMVLRVVRVHGVEQLVSCPHTSIACRVTAGARWTADWIRSGGTRSYYVVMRPYAWSGEGGRVMGPYKLEPC